MYALETKFSVCKDCMEVITFGNEAHDALIFAYGEEEAAKVFQAACDGEKRLTRQVKDEFRHVEFHTVNVDFEEEKSFSWQHCECCKSNLGGDRYTLKIYVRGELK